MTALWFQALQETDTSAAGALMPHAQACARQRDSTPDEADATACAWLGSVFPAPNMVILPGVSQMDLVAPLLVRKPSLNILLLDPDPCRLAAALNGIDSLALADAIRGGRVRIDPCESEESSMDRFMRAADFSRVPRIRVLEARPLSEEEFQWVVDRTRASRELIRFQACDMSTRLRFGTAWQDQTVRNLPQIMRHPGIGSLFGAFSGAPALVIAAGPSLNETLPFLFRVRHRVVVIAVGRVLRALVHRLGIVPDLAVTGDGQDLVIRHFDKKPKGLPVAASCFTEPQLIRTLDRIFFMEVMSMGMPAWLREKIGPRGEIYPGGNVSTAAMSVAVNLGCNPIFLAGLDLSYANDGRRHATAKSTPKAPSDAAEDTKTYEVPGNYQPMVQTNRQMLHYIDFARDYILGNAHLTFYNVNTAGARIDGTRLMRPEEMAAQVSTTPINAAGRIARIYEAQKDTVDAERVVRALREDVSCLRSLQTECRDAAMVCNQMIMLMRRPGASANAEAEARAALAKLEPLDARLKTDPIMHLIEARLETVSRLLSEKMMTPQERALTPAVRSFQRWRGFYRGVADACRKTETLLNRVIRGMEAAPPGPSLPRDASAEDRPAAAESVPNRDNPKPIEESV